MPTWPNSDSNYTHPFSAAEMENRRWRLVLKGVLGRHCADLNDCEGNKLSLM